MEIRYWHCQKCAGVDTPCLAVIVGSSSGATIATKCLQDVDTKPEWREIDRGRMDECINTVKEYNHGN